MVKGGLDEDGAAVAVPALALEDGLRALIAQNQILGLHVLLGIPPAGMRTAEAGEQMPAVLGLFRLRCLCSGARRPEYSAQTDQEQGLDLSHLSGYPFEHAFTADQPGPAFPGGEPEDVEGLEPEFSQQRQTPGKLLLGGA